MNTTIVLLVVTILIIVICLYMKYCQTNKLKENLTMTVTSKNVKSPYSNYSPSSFPQGCDSMPHLNDCSKRGLFDDFNRRYHHHREHNDKGCVDSECHKSMMGMFSNMFNSLPSVDKLPHITHTLQITPKNEMIPINSDAPTAAVTNHASIIPELHSTSAPAHSIPAPVKTIDVPVKTTSSSSTSYVPIGPFKDESNRAMENMAPKRLNPDECSAHCKDYDYFGLQDYVKGQGSQCFCSNDIKKTTQYKESSCGPNGGPWCNYVYANNTQNKNYSSGNFMTYLNGGYVNGNSQDLYPTGSGFNSLTDAMNKCNTTADCGGVTLTPVFSPPYSIRKNKTLTKFAGNLETSWVKKATTPSSTTSNSYVPIGPFKDESNRAMENMASKRLNPDECSAHCKDYDYFGLQDYVKGQGSQCFCSNDIKKTTQYKESSCGPNGGPWCNYVYANNTQNKNYSIGNFMSYLGGYVNGNSQDLYPTGSGFNSLTDAMNKCDTTADCGGVTLTPVFSPPYSMRKNKTPTKFAGNLETSWVKKD